MIWLYIDLVLLAIIVVLPIFHYRLYRREYYFSKKLYKLREIRFQALIHLQDYISDPSRDHAQKEIALRFVNKLMESSYLLDRLESRLFSWRTFAESFVKVYEAFLAVRNINVAEPWLARIKQEFECKTATVFRALPVYEYRLLAGIASRMSPIFAFLGWRDMSATFHNLRKAVRLWCTFRSNGEPTVCSSC